MAGYVKVDRDQPIEGDFLWSGYTRNELSTLHDDALSELNLKRADTKLALSYPSEERTVYRLDNGSPVVAGAYVGKARKPDRPKAPTAQQFAKEFGLMFVDNIRAINEIASDCKDQKLKFDAQKQIVTLGMEMAKSDRWEKLLTTGKVADKSGKVLEPKELPQESLGSVVAFTQPN